MFWDKILWLLLFRCFLQSWICTSHQSRVLLQRWIDQILQLIHIVDTLINEIQILQIIQRLCYIRVTAQFYLFNNVNVLLFTRHYFLYLSFTFYIFLFCFKKLYNFVPSSKEVIFIILFNKIPFLLKGWYFY